MPDEEVGKREHQYPRYELLTPEIFERMALVMTEGAKKYAPLNWQKFNAAQVADIIRHAFVHIQSYMQEHTKAVYDFNLKELAMTQGEDHLANAACNIMMLMWYQANRPEVFIEAIGRKDP